MKSLTQKTKNRGNNAVSRRFGKYSFQKTRTKIEVFLALPCWLSQLNWESQQGRGRKTSILVRAFWNFKLQVPKYPRNCRLHATLIPNLVKPLNCMYLETKQVQLLASSKGQYSYKCLTKANELCKNFQFRHIGLSKNFLPMKISKRLLVAELSSTHHWSTTYQAVPGRAPAPLYDCQFTTCSQFHTLLSILLTHCLFTEKFRKFRIKCKRSTAQRKQILCNSRELWFMHIWLEVCTMYVR